MSEGIKSISWKIDKLPEKEKERIRSFVSAQKNMQSTLNFIAMHYIERFGAVDIMDFNVQKVLFEDLSKYESRVLDQQTDSVQKVMNNSKTPIINKSKESTIINKKESNNFDLAENADINSF